MGGVILSDMVNQMNMDEIYRKYAIPLKRFVMSLCHNETIAEDVVADTFYKAIKNIDSFKEGNIFTWLCTIAKNTYLNYLKKKDSENISLDGEDIPEPAAPSSVEEECVKKETRIELYREIQKLEPMERDVIYLRIFAGLSYKEIGDILQKSESYVRVTYFRCKEKLKGQMRDE